MAVVPDADLMGGDGLITNVTQPGFAEGFFLLGGQDRDGMLLQASPKPGLVGLQDFQQVGDEQVLLSFFSLVVVFKHDLLLVVDEYDGVSQREMKGRGLSARLLTDALCLLAGTAGVDVQLLQAALHV